VPRLRHPRLNRSRERVQSGYAIFEEPGAPAEPEECSQVRIDGCVHFDDPEWRVVTDKNFRTAEGTVSNSFLSGGDWSGDHNGMPDGHYVGVHTDVMTHDDASGVRPAAADCARRYRNKEGHTCHRQELHVD